MAGAGYKQWTAGAILTAADLNTYLAQQVTMVFASATARDSAVTAPSEGMLAYLADVDQYTFYDGSAWQIALTCSKVSFTPTWTNLTVGNGTNTGYYVKAGRAVTLYVSFTFGSTSSLGSTDVRFNLPFTATGAQYGAFQVLYADSGVASYNGYADANASQAYMRIMGVSGSYPVPSQIGGGTPFTFGTNDVITVSGTYMI